MVDSMSTIMEPAAVSDLNERIAERVRELRAGQGLSLDTLATRSGVSRSMISLIERGESSPTAVVLEKLAAGLGVMLASLFDAPAAPQPSGPVARREDQPQWRDPASGYVRRNVSPPGVPQPMQIVEVFHSHPVEGNDDVAVTKPSRDCGTVGLERNDQNS